MITSAANPRIKQLIAWQTKAKERKKDGVFVAEGIKMLEEAPKQLIREIYLAESLEQRLKQGKTDREKQLLQKIQTQGYELVSDEVMKRTADTMTPQGVLTVAEQPSYRLESMLAKESGLYLLLEDIQDPGNLGTIVRTAEGAGVDGIIMSRETVDIFNPKTIRSTMGSVFRVPFIYEESLEKPLQIMRQRGITTYAAHLAGTKSYTGFSYEKASAFLIGNEGNGLKEETAKCADYFLKIPMEGKLESLNAAVATALLIYEAHRQRN